MTSIYNSRDLNYKTPFGAVSAGTPVSFSMRAPRSLAVSRAVLCATFEFDRETLELDMPWVGLEGDCDVYTAALPTDSRLGPVWYYFTVQRFDRPTVYVGRNTEKNDGSGDIFEEIPPVFQLTVYDGGYNVPDWYGRGVTYHIFPDRFHRLTVPDPAGLVGDRTVHRNWSDTPDYLPDDKGEIKNRDFFGGSLAGVKAKLPYLQSLGVTTIYFSPIFEAASNHRYDTADYMNVDPMFGTTQEFTALCEEAGRLGMKILLDGVFNHTGYDSRYFNGRGTYPDAGAHQSKDSPYYGWYDFQDWPFRYSSWWGVYTLPQVNENNKAYVDFIIRKKDSVIRHWLRAGASGWRLDVADELPDEFIAQLRTAARKQKKDAVIIGEVWEDASTKISYDVRRRYLLGHELDGVMNYPFRNAVLGFLLGHDAQEFCRAMEELRENYPRQAYYSLMNILGTHDTPRVLTVLGAEGTEYAWPAERRADHRLPRVAREMAIRRLKMGALIQFAFPGSPCVYYGDEAGLEGFGDPFNRRGYPWGREEKTLVDWYARLGQLRESHTVLQTGNIRYLHARGSLLVFEREAGRRRAVAAVNAGCEDVVTHIPWVGKTACDAMSGAKFPVRANQIELTVPAMTGLLLV